MIFRNFFNLLVIINIVTKLVTLSMITNIKIFSLKVIIITHVIYIGLLIQDTFNPDSFKEMKKIIIYSFLLTGTDKVIKIILFFNSGEYYEIQKTAISLLIFYIFNFSPIIWRIFEIRTNTGSVVVNPS